MSASKHTLYPEILKQLLELDAWLVPLRGRYGVALPDDEGEYNRWKVPTRSWLDRAACGAAVRGRLGGNHWVGLIPSSLGLVVLDLDEGEGDALAATLSARDYRFLRVRTRRGWHFFMRAADDWPEGNWKWTLAGCAGDVRYDAGYVILWDPIKTLETIELGAAGAAGASLATEMGNRVTPAQAALPGTTEGATDGGIGPERYPPGDRDDQLLTDLNRLAHEKLIDNEVVVDRYRQAWLAAAKPKASEDRRAIFEDKLTRARAYVAQEQAAKVAEGVYAEKSADVLRQCLAKLNIAWAYNKRSGRYEYKQDGTWLQADKADALEARMIEDIASQFRFERAQGGTVPLRFSMAQFEQYMTALVGLYPERSIDDFCLWLERELPEWDGTARIETLLTDLFGAADDKLTRWASRYLFLAAIQRAYQPACKLDEFPVLIGRQGWGKSALLANLFPSEKRGPWYTPSLDMTAPVKERIEASMGAVVVEVAEMAGVGRDLQRQKAWFTTTSDKARLAYDRTTSDVKRRFALAGTADRRDSLPNDPAGNRRFVAIELAYGADVEAHLEAHRLQLWAEGLHLYRTGSALGEWRIANLPRDLMAAQAVVNEEYRRRDDDIEDRVANLTGNDLSYATIVERIGLPANLNKSQRARLTSALEQAGWRRKTLYVNGKRPVVWRRAQSSSLL